MKKILDRQEAILLVSFYEMLDLSEEEHREVSNNVLIEESLEFAPVATLNFLVRDYLKVSLEHVSNRYLQSVLSKNIKHEIIVEGDDNDGRTCPCCGYRTISQRGNYDICSVCFWEDDGSDDVNCYSPTNQMTLLQAQTNFAHYGAVEEKYQNRMDPKRMEKYEK